MIFGRKKAADPRDGKFGPEVRALIVAATGGGPLGKRWELLCNTIGLDPETAAPNDVIKALRDEEGRAVTEVADPWRDM